MNSSPNRDITKASSRIQKDLLTRFTKSPGTNDRAISNFFDTLKETDTEMMQRRLESRRHPMTGISGPRVQTSPYKYSEVLQDAMKRSHKLNPRILETWLNNTVADADAFDMPSSVIKQENKQPLARFGIDRSSLINAGLPSFEIDHLYQSLFVHSIGFYQLILKVLEHTNKKYSIVTGIWKVFAILLEYCCQLDYEMIITTLNLEKREEIEQLENEYKGQISIMEEHQKRLIENIANFKDQLRNVQKDLQKEIGKREELEDELLQRGSGHEEEVAMRLSFESKLNQMYAKQRDLATKIEQLAEITSDQQKIIDSKTEQIAKEKKRANDLIQGKIEAEQEMKKTEERLKQLEVINMNLENRLDESMNKIENLNTQTSKTLLELSESLNEIAQKRILIDDQLFEIDVFKVQISKLNLIIQENSAEKQIFTTRLAELEKTYTEEYERNKHFEQEYAFIKEAEATASSELKKYKSRFEELAATYDEVLKDRDKLKVELDSTSMVADELKNQVNKSQERMEEMNKGRRIVEELNENLKKKVDEKSADLIEARKVHVEQKGEIENLQSRENELVSEVATLSIKIKSLEKQFETTKETLQDKINNLNDILSSEKKIRENWIYRYEEEQKMHANVTKELIETEDKLNETVMKLNSTSSSLEEKSNLLNRSILKNKEQFEEILNLKSLEEEFSRKNKTLNILIGNIDKENREKLREIGEEIEEMKSDHLREIERKNIVFEDLWIVAQLNYESLLKRFEDIRNLEKTVEGKKCEIEELKIIIEEKNRSCEAKSMVVAELEHFIMKQSEKINKNLKEVESLNLKFLDLNKDYQNFLNKIPKNLRGEKNPFLVLENRIFDLESELKSIKETKENMIDEAIQFQYTPESYDRESQTEIDSFEFDKLSRKSVSKPGEKVDRCIQSSMPELERPSIAPSQGSSKNFSVKKKISTDEGVKFNESSKNLESKKSLRQQSADSVQREEEVVTPVNLKSVYKHAEENAEENKASDMKLPYIGKKLTPVRPTTMANMLLSSEIKRHIRQANSRRKHDSMY